MSSFEQSYWADASYAGAYRDHSHHYIVDRHSHFMIMESALRNHVGLGRGARLLDLGCGDGALSEPLLALDPSLQATLVDGSAEMLAGAEARLQGHPALRTVPQTFEGLIADSAVLGRYDLVVSAFAIHHLDLAGKAALFQIIFDHLEPGGLFLNVDTVLSDDPAHVDWYYALFREWIEAREARLKPAQSYVHIPAVARNNPDNQLSTLAAQLECLKSLGFVQVECHYKYGLFVVYSGQKPGR